MTSALSGPSVDISVVVPILNERDNLRELHQRLTRVLGALERSYEIFFVDDGSSDGSVELSRELVEEDPHLALIELRRNFGKATALQAGFELTRGEMIITMDGDLQDDAEEIPRFLAALDSGFDLVSGWKQNRQDPASKTLPSRFFNFVTSWVTGVSLQDFNCGFKAYRREVVKGLNLYGELHRYIPAIAHGRGFRIGEIPVRHHPRRHGESKYHLARFWRGAFDLFTIAFLNTFQRRPLHLFGCLGLGFFFAGFLFNAYLAIQWFSGRTIGNRPLLLLGTLLISVGIQVLLFGLLAEMLTASSYRRAEVLDFVRIVYRPTAAPVAPPTPVRPDDTHATQ
jgi:glycosyltransferase involved in cell wall biosynthesis